MIYSLFAQTFLLAADVQDAVWLKHIWWWSLPLMVVGLFALILIVVQFVKMFREATICRVPLADVNEVEINRVGELFLRFEVPRDSTLTGENLHYALLNRQRGNAPVELKAVSNPLTTKSGQKRSFPVRVFQIAETGKYLLEVSNFNPQEDYSACSLLISRPLHLKAFLFILGIVLTGLMFVGGLVFTLIAVNTNN